MKLHLFLLLTTHPFTFQGKEVQKHLLPYLLMTDRCQIGLVIEGSQRCDVFNGQVNLNHKCTFPPYHLIVFNLIKADLPEPLPLIHYKLIFSSSFPILFWIYTRRLRISESLRQKKTIFTAVNRLFCFSICLKPLRVFFRRRYQITVPLPVVE